MHPVVGKVIAGDAHRDAIHVAIAPAVAKVLLWPGQGVDKNGGCDGDEVGIVDPFLKTSVKPGQKFYIFIAPNTVTSLRHEWTHPMFDPTTPSEMAEAMAWVKAYAEEHCPYWSNPDPDFVRRGIMRADVDAYTEFMRRVREGDIFFYGNDLHGISELPEPDLLFKHLSTILGRPVSAEGFTYSCSC